MPQSTLNRATELHEVVTPELQHALARHTQWFGSYKKSGELKKIHVWLSVHQGQIEFLTPGDSYKVKRVRRNPHVICYVGGKDGPRDPRHRPGHHRSRRTHAGLPHLLEDPSHKDG